LIEGFAAALECLAEATADEGFSFGSIRTPAQGRLEEVYRLIQKAFVKRGMPCGKRVV